MTMSPFAERVGDWFGRLTARTRLEVELPLASRRTRLGRKGMFFCRLDRPSRPGERFTKPKDVAPLVTIALYGPDDDRATKLVLAHHATGRGESDPLERWVAADVLADEKIIGEARQFLDRNRPQGISMVGGTLGCPHEEGEDFPEGGDCPVCPFWKGKQGSAHDS